MNRPVPNELELARIRAGRAIRDLGHAFVGHQNQFEVLDRLAGVVDDAAAELRRGARRDRVTERERGDWGPPPDHGEEMFSYDERPISGQASPYGLDLRVFRDGDEAVGRVTLQAAHEGAPGRSHGGIVSALFDDVFGFMLSLSMQPAFTGTLTVRYEHGTPIGVPLECRVRVDGVEGRKMHMSGEVSGHVDGEHVVYARSTAVFITIPAAGYSAAVTDR